MTDTNTLAPTDDQILALNAGEVHFSESPSKYPAAGFGTQYHAGAPGVLSFARAVLAAKWGAPAPASQPFAYEFSRSNGDGTHSEHIERGRLQEVAPGRWEHSGLPRGALADKPIKALYTTPQTQPAAVLASGMGPVAWLHDCAALLTNDVELWIDACPHCGKPHNAPQPVAVPAAGPVGFDHKTAANFLNRKTVTDEEVRQFVAHSRWAHDDRDGLRNTIADLRREIAQRDAEIALLKTSLLDAESPTQAAQAAPVDASVLRDEAFEAVRLRLCRLERYSFVLDDGVVRRVRDRVGNWIEFDDAHELFDPVAVDAATAAQQGDAA